VLERQGAVGESDARRVRVLALLAAVTVLGCGFSRAAGAPAWSASEGVRTLPLTVSGAAGIAGFTAIGPGQSGVAFTNELRGDLSLTNAVAHNGAGVAVGDVDGDGWVDLYFCNLQGPPANPDAVGAQVRLRYRGGQAGPVRGIQAGSGYWSQDSAAQVLGFAGSPESLWIRWPGGREQVVPLSADQREVDVIFEYESQ
jgi:hypothetical protein